MYINRVKAEEYEDVVQNYGVFFNDPKFTELNKYKADDVYYLIAKEGESSRFGFIFGRRGDSANAPFSAPYAYPVQIKNFQKIQDYDSALEAVERYLISEGITSIKFVLPPVFYDEHQLTAWISSFYRHGYKLSNLDISYSLVLKDLCTSEDYTMNIPKKGRTALKKAKGLASIIIRCETKEEYKRAYDVVKRNHDSKNRPTHLSFDELMRTMELVGGDAFIVENNGKDVVAEFLYRVNEKIVQGIYCGTLPEYSDLRGMNLLTDYVLGYYFDRGFEIIDKGTATESSIPNEGLCAFKDSVGGCRNLKFSFEKCL